MAELYLQYEYAIAATQLFLAMLGMGATLAVGDFLRVFGDKKVLLGGLSLQIIIVPLIAWLLIVLLDASPGLAVGLALCAAIPGGTTSNIFTHFARGDIALSIAITGLSTLACLVTTPWVLNFLVQQYMPAEFVMPVAQISKEILVFLLLPLTFGMFLKRNLSAYSDLISKWAIRGSLLGIILIVIGATVAGRLDMDSFGAANAWRVLVFLFCLMTVSAVLPAVFGFSTGARTALNIEVTVRNTNLGILILASLFPAALVADGPMQQLGNHAFFTVLMYGGVQLLAAAVLIFVYRRLLARDGAV